MGLSANSKQYSILVKNNNTSPAPPPHGLNTLYDFFRLYSSSTFYSDRQICPHTLRSDAIFIKPSRLISITGKKDRYTIVTPLPSNFQIQDMMVLGSTLEFINGHHSSLVPKGEAHREPYLLCDLTIVKPLESLRYSYF